MVLKLMKELFKFLHTSMRLMLLLMLLHLQLELMVLVLTSTLVRLMPRKLYILNTTEVNLLMVALLMDLLMTLFRMDLILQTMLKEQVEQRKIKNKDNSLVLLMSTRDSFKYFCGYMRKYYTTKMEI